MRSTSCVALVTILLAAVAVLAAPPPPPERIEAPGIENLYRLGPQLLSGGQPEGEAAFEALKKLGVKTVISVDGAPPDVAMARRFGLRYVHLPIGYDGVPREQAIRLIAATRGLPGPIFVHCHHGKHRGPAAAAVCAIATEDWDPATAHSWMERAGTDPRYSGLFASVDGFRVPSRSELESFTPESLPEAVEPPGLVETMIEVDATWDRLQKSRKEGFPAPANPNDAGPAREARLLSEHFREAARLVEAKSRGTVFLASMTAAANETADLEADLQAFQSSRDPASRERLDGRMTRLAKSCVDCHARFRDHRNREAR